jgi:hypothetical protein
LGHEFKAAVLYFRPPGEEVVQDLAGYLGVRALASAFGTAEHPLRVGSHPRRIKFLSYSAIQEPLMIVRAKYDFEPIFWLLAHFVFFAVVTTSYEACKVQTHRGERVRAVSIKAVTNEGVSSSLEETQ